MFCFSSYVKTLKKISKDKNISDEKFVNELLQCYTYSTKTVNRQGDEFFLDKGRVSRLLAGKDDIPRAIRDSLSLIDVQKKTREAFADFAEDYLDKDYLPYAVESLREIIRSDAILPASTKNRALNQADSLDFLAELLLLALVIKNNYRDRENIILRNGTYFLDVVYGNLLDFGFRNRKKLKNIVVVPVETTYETCVTGEYEKNNRTFVSKTSIHGQWLMRMGMMEDVSENLKTRIEENLRINGYSEIDGHYPIGSISVIEIKNAIFWLLAISRFDENNNAQSCSEDILQAIASLLRFYDRMGDGYDLYLPLMGTGKSRANLSLQESYDMFVSYIKNDPKLLQGNIHVVIPYANESLVKIGGEDES